MVAAVVGQHPLGQRQVGEQVGVVRRDQQVPHVAVRLALEARGVRQQPPDGRAAVRGHVQVRRDRVVQVQQAVVAGLHDQYGGERLGDRADPEPAVRVQRMPGVARVADGAGPEAAVGAVQRDRERGNPGVGLHPAHRALQALLWRHRDTIGPSGRAAEDVRVHVEDLLAAVGAAVEDQPEAVGEQPLGLGDRGGRGQHVGGGLRVRVRHGGHVLVMRLGNHQDVHGRLRVDVAEGERGVGLVHDGRGDFSGDDAAEQAVVVHPEDPRVTS
nr:hypothetical protein GCM10020092_091280 [Actinoplanes digitatis]